MSTDWLDEPAEDDTSWLEPQEQWPIEMPAPEDELAFVPRGVSGTPIPTDSKERNEVVQKAWNALSARQQKFLVQLKACRFNVSDACRVQAKAGEPLHRATANRWADSDENYSFVLKVMRAIARDRVIDPDKLLMRADEIAEKALEPVPILFQGRPTGFFEHKLDTALKANEQLMKTQKMLGNDDDGRGRVTEGPALIIQVVQRDGGVIDVTPRGVTIDLPGPEDGN